MVELFPRRLAPGARPLAEHPAILSSPVDARVGAFGRIEGTTLLQAKGMEYELAALLGDASAPACATDPRRTREGSETCPPGRRRPGGARR